MTSLGWQEIILLLFVLLANIVFWGALVFVIVKLVNKRPKNEKKCPFCAEFIQREAILCRYCGRDLP